MPSFTNHQTEALLKIFEIGRAEIAAGEFESVKDVFEEVDAEVFKTATQAPLKNPLPPP